LTGAGLRRIRLRLGLTQGEMAKRMGVPRETYNRWEQRGQRALWAPIGLLAKLLGRAKI
jgi:transcriptional regulator with XRE-family HTH domain